MYHDTISFHAKDNLNWHSTLFIRQGLRIGFRIRLGVRRHFEKRKAEVKKACELLLKMKETKELDFEDDYQELKESYELLCKC